MNCWPAIINILRPFWPQIAGNTPPPAHRVPIDHNAWDRELGRNSHYQALRTCYIGQPPCTGTPCICELSRADLYRLAYAVWQAGPNNLPELKRLFIATVIWGNGLDKRWYFRPAVMLRSPNFNSIIRQVSRAVYEGFIGNAYGTLHRNQTSLINELGATFATKFLYFLATPLNCKIKPLILDDRVSISLRKLIKKAKLPDEYWRYITNAAPQLTNPRWTDSGYLEYLIIMHHTACALGVRADQLEMFLWEPPPNFP